MVISIIAAMDEKQGIGFRGKIPWHISSDLRRFKRLTANHHILMGRKTYQSIGKMLPDRINMIISRNKEFTAPGCFVFDSVDKALLFAQSAAETELFVIGGAEIYREILPVADKMYLTTVKASFKVDRKFPRFEKEDWNQIEEASFPASETDEHATVFRVYLRKKDK
jgi:dihydrofolate reductase